MRRWPAGRSGRARPARWGRARSAFTGAIAGRTRSRCCGAFMPSTISRPRCISWSVPAPIRSTTCSPGCAGLIPVYFLGLATPLTPAGGAVSALLVLAVTLWGFLIHANVRCRFGLLEWLISTPAFHHWHHTLGKPRDRNYASMLPCMVWIFGTWHLPKAWPVAYGSDTELLGSLAGQLLYPLTTRPQPVRSPETEAVSR